MKRPLKRQLTELAGQLGLKRVPGFQEVEFPASPSSRLTASLGGAACEPRGLTRAEELR